MARGFISTLNQIAREAQRAERSRIKEVERQRRQIERDERQTAVAQRAEYLANKEALVATRNSQLQRQLADFESILASRLGYNPVDEFKQLFRAVDNSQIENNKDLLVPPKPDIQDFTPAEPAFFLRWIPSVMRAHREQAERAKALFDSKNKKREEIIWRRSDAIVKNKSEVDSYNNSIIELATSYAQGDPKSISEYFEIVLQISRYPDPIQLEARTAFVPESKQLVVEIELPTFSAAVPSVEKYRYIKKTNEIVETAKNEKTRTSIYTDLIAQTAIRCLYEICTADNNKVAETIVLNAYVSSINPATGHAVRPCIVSVRITRDVFMSFDFHHIDPVACLKQLKATVSSQPGELLAVRPILDLNMVDPRFIQEADVLSTLDQRPNLMELTPSEFESLITNLFGEMGLETKQTQASRDGGVDCVAFDARPILGGKVVIQAKRYKNTVGVAAVRDLFGTLHNEGASKGILVTTSGFGKAAYDFANGKPIELITGSNLLYLLKEHAEVDAKIEAPPDWVDPRIDIQ